MDNKLRKGQQFGWLTIIGKDFIRDSKGNKVYGYKCKCKCGNIRVIKSTTLNGGKYKSCGCRPRNYDEIINKRFNNLVVEEYLYTSKRKYETNKNISYWKCRCDCGNSITLARDQIIPPKVKDCGCSKKPLITKHPLYKTWSTMKQRCSNSNKDNYQNYGGRGIKVCDEWIHNFERFVKDMGERPDGMTLDRINNHGDYCKGNCKWSTQSDQNLNRRPFIVKPGNINQKDIELLEREIATMKKNLK